MESKIVSMMCNLGTQKQTRTQNANKERKGGRGAKKKISCGVEGGEAELVGD